MASPIEYHDRAAYFPAEDTLVVADLHLGRSRTASFERPLDDVVAVVDRLLELVDELAPERLVLAGDVLDAFDTIPPGVVERFERLQAGLDEAGVALTVLRGNHDPLLETLVEEVHQTVTVGDSVICHGHERPDRTGERYVLGHDHPAIRIEGVKRPCFLDGPAVYRGADVVVLPAFNRLIRGVLINRRSSRECHSPIVTDTDLGQYRPIVVEDDLASPLEFPPLDSLRAFL